MHDPDLILAQHGALALLDVTAVMNGTMGNGSWVRIGAHVVFLVAPLVQFHSQRAVAEPIDNRVLWAFLVE